ncbi:MAG: helix-turn-helix domain-containing protein [Planctomycetota bacterium]|jgi:AraC-like DNA-binding protein
MLYVETEPLAAQPQFLDVACEGRPCRFHLLHATLEERRRTRGKRPRVREVTRTAVGHTHDVYHVVLFTRGESRFALGGRAVPCRPGTLVVTCPGEVHDFGPLKGSEVYYRELAFALEGDRGPLRLGSERVLELFTGRELAGAEFPVELRPRVAAEMGRVFERMVPALVERRDFLAAWVEIARIVTIIADEVHRPEEALGPPGRGPLAGRIARAREAIELRFAERLSVAELAREAGLSKEYFIRSFKAEVGLPPVAFQRRVRIRAAMRLLATAGLSCGEIADLVGFGDVYQFSRAFSGVAGVPPTEYRRRAREGTAIPG